MKTFKKHIILIFILTFSPLLVYFHRFFPESNSMNIFGLYVTVDKSFDLNFLSWVLLYKIYFTLLLIIWFKYCKHWWKLAILVPIIIELFKVTTILNSNLSYIDEGEHVESLPIIIPIVILMLIVSIRINLLNQARRLVAVINKKIEQITVLTSQQNEIISGLRNEFEYIKQKKNDMGKDQYLDELRKLINQLNNT